VIIDAERDRHLRTLNEIPALLSSREKKVKFHGAVFSPGEETLGALRKAAKLLPVEFTVYGSAPDVAEIESLLGDTCYEFIQTKDSVRELSQYLSVERSVRDKPVHFVLRGDFLSLDDTYRAISLTGSAGDVTGATSIGAFSGKTASESTPKSATTEKPFLSHVAVLEAASQARVLVVSDGFVNPRPDIKTRLAIIKNALRVCKTIGISYPRVALLAAVEQVYAGMPVTVESEEIAKMSAAGEITGAHVDGPLSFDVALVEQVAKDKGAIGEVAGRADLLVGSSIEVANGIYMAQTMLARANAASVVVGGKAPLALPFPSDCIDNIFFSMCLACLISTNGVASTA